MAVTETTLSAAAFQHRYRRLILLAWLLPAVVGFSFIAFIRVFTVEQLLGILISPVNLVFIGGWVFLALWYFDQLIRPLKTFMQEGDCDAAQQIEPLLRRFPRHFWGLFLCYLLMAPAEVIILAESITNFTSSGMDWFRIHLVALIVSIIVGLPIFFALFDLFGQALSTAPLQRPILSIRTRVFMIGALVPLLVDTMLVQYYWTRTGYFTLETLGVWAFLQLLAVAGAAMFLRSFDQSLRPLQGVVAPLAALIDTRPFIRPNSTDELGVLAGRYQLLLRRLHYQAQTMQAGKLALQGDGKDAVGRAFERMVAICREALNADLAFLLLVDETREALLGVAHTGAGYRPEGHYRLPLDSTSLAVRAFLKGRPLAIDDVRNDNRVSPEMVARFDIQAAIACPLKAESELIGVLIAADQTPGRRYDEDDTILIEGLAQEAAAVAHTHRLQQHRRRAEQRYQEANEFTRATLESIADGVIATDTEGRVEYLNPVAEHLTGWREAEALGRPLGHVLQLLDATTREPLPNPIPRALASSSGLPLDAALLLVPREGRREYPVEARIAPIHNSEGRPLGGVLVFHDTSELTTLAHRLSYQASHDALTGLVNRREFEARLELALEDARHSDSQHVLCFMDLDRFKVVNDTCGHAAGDELLKQLATRMRASIREADTLGRLGGDEFGLLLENCHLPQARTVVENLLQMVGDYRLLWQDKIFAVGVSIGMVPIDAHNCDITELLSAADAACYLAKAEGRNRLHIYEPDDLAISLQRSEMQCLQDIRQALDGEGFALYQQAIRPLAGSTEPPHAEVLLRLRRDNDSLAAPNAFLPTAERYHLMPQIDRWVLRHALAVLSQLRARGETLHLSINLSGQTLSDEQFPQFVTQTLHDSGVPPDWLCFEVTETTAIANFNRAVALIADLKGLGCRFALDDFGSGLSSFNYLKSLPLDYLKIDGAFVQDMDQNAVDRAMVAAINEIGHLMGIRTVAEFVTRETVFQTLQEVGVDYAQGYFIGQPRPLPDTD